MTLWVFLPYRRRADSPGAWRRVDSLGPAMRTQVATESYCSYNPRKRGKTTDLIPLETYLAAHNGDIYLRIGYLSFRYHHDVLRENHEISQLAGRE